MMRVRHLDSGFRFQNDIISVNKHIEVLRFLLSLARKKIFFFSARA